MECCLFSVVVIVVVLIIIGSMGGKDAKAPNQPPPSAPPPPPPPLAKPVVQFEERGDLTGWKIVLIGRTGAGKSSLINMIVGRQILAADPVASTTRWIEGVPIRYGQQRVVLVDTPGYGEAFTATEYREGIIAWLLKHRPDVALLVFVVQADAKAHAEDKALLDDVFRTFGYMPILVVLNQVDKVPLARQPLVTKNWFDEQRTGSLKSRNIEEKIAEVKRQFGSATVVVEPAAAVHCFNRQRIVQLLAEQLRINHPEQGVEHSQPTSTTSGPVAARGNGQRASTGQMRVLCPGCRATMTWPESMAGQLIRCPQCGQEAELPR